MGVRSLIVAVAFAVAAFSASDAWAHDQPGYDVKVYDTVGGPEDDLQIEVWANHNAPANGAQLQVNANITVSAASPTEVLFTNIDTRDRAYDVKWRFILFKDNYNPVLKYKSQDPVGDNPIHMGIAAEESWPAISGLPLSDSYTVVWQDLGNHTFSTETIAFPIVNSLPSYEAVADHGHSVSVSP